MFDIGSIELLVIAIIAIIVVGPKDLPALLRKIGSAISYIKKMASEFQSHVRDTVEETGVNDLKKSFDEASQFDWTEDDENAAQTHNEKIMKEHELGEEETTKTTRKKSPAKNSQTPGTRKKAKGAKS